MDRHFLSGDWGRHHLRQREVVVSVQIKRSRPEAAPFDSSELATSAKCRLAPDGAGEGLGGRVLLLDGGAGDVLAELAEVGGVEAELLHGNLPRHNVLGVIACGLGWCARVNKRIWD